RSLSACAAIASPRARRSKNSRPRSARCAIRSSAASSESSTPRAASTASSSASSGRDKRAYRWVLYGRRAGWRTRMSAAVSQDKFFYGGQAVLEGVLMRGRTTYAVAVRRPAGEQIELSAGAMRITIGIAIVGVAIFFLGLPLLAAGFLSRGHGNLFFGLVDGFIRIGLLLLYLYAISFKSEIKRLFAYHGAEH